MEDCIVENKQAIEMAKIHTEILSNMSNTFAAVISNNLNVAMKVLAIITVVMAIPTMLFSAYGMNVMNIPLSEHPYGFAIIIAIAVVASIVTMIIILKIKLFK